MEQFLMSWAAWASTVNMLLLFCILFWFGTRITCVERILRHAPYAKLVQGRRAIVKEEVAYCQEPIKGDRHA